VEQEATMTDSRSFNWNEAGRDLAGKTGRTVPNSARFWCCLQGGKDYFKVDERAAQECAQLYPDISGTARTARYLTARMVRYLAGEAGIRQFLDIGAGLPGRDNTHEIAQRAAPGCRVVYADNDKMVMVFARALLAGDPPGSTRYICADLSDPDALLRLAQAELDFSQPVAILLMHVLGHIGDPREDGDAAAQAVAGRLRDALPPGGYLAISEIADTDPAMNTALAHYARTGAVPYRPRQPDQIARFLTGLEPVAPGIVPAHLWRPDPSPSGPLVVPVRGGAARKPPNPAPPAPASRRTTQKGSMTCPL
jgi:hypothetical protein